MSIKDLENDNKELSRMALEWKERAEKAEAMIKKIYEQALSCGYACFDVIEAVEKAKEA